MQRLLLQADNLRVSILHVLQSIDLILNTLFQHIHYIIEDVVQSVLHLLQLICDSVRRLADTFTSAVSQRTQSVDVLECRLVLIFVQSGQRQVCIDKVPSSVSSLFSGIKQIVQRRNVALLLCNSQSFNIRQRTFNSKLLSFGRNHSTNPLFIDNKLSVFVNQVCQVFLSHSPDALQGVYGDKSTLSVLVRRVMECVVNILDSINRVGSLFNDTIQKLHNLLTGFLGILSEFFPVFRTVTIFLVQVRQRTNKIFSFLPQSVRGFLQSVVFTLAVSSQLVQVLHVFDPKLIGISVILYLKTQISKRLNASGDCAVSLVVQIVQRLLLTLIGTDQLTLQKNFLSQIVRVVNFGFKLRSGLLCLAQPLNRLSIVVDSSNILFDIFLRVAT